MPKRLIASTLITDYRSSSVIEQQMEHDLNCPFCKKIKCPVCKREIQTK